MSESGSLTRQQLQHQAEFVIKGLKRLAEYDYHLGITDTPADLSIDRLRSEAELLTQLEYNLLPQLRRHIESFPKPLLGGLRHSLRKTPAPTLVLVLEILPQLELTLDQIIRAVNRIIPGQVPALNPTDDQHLKELKCYRLRGLAHSIRKEMQRDLAFFFSDCSRRLIRAFSLPQEDQRSRAGNSFPAALRSIDGAMRWSSASELDIVCKGLEKHVAEIDRLLDVLIVMANPENDEDMRTPLVIRLAQSCIPLFKLSKLFFKKITSLEGIDRNEEPFCTEMSSYQLDLLEVSARKISKSLSCLVAQLKAPFEHPARNSSGHLNDIISPFQSCLLLADLYIIPTCTDCSSLSYFKIWFVTWNTLFSQATSNAIKAPCIRVKVGFMGQPIDKKICPNPTGQVHELRPGLSARLTKPLWRLTKKLAPKWLVLVWMLMGLRPNQHPMLTKLLTKYNPFTGLGYKISKDLGGDFCRGKWYEFDWGAGFFSIQTRYQLFSGFLSSIETERS
ncbi:hypothetical protein PTTG_12283 [Puccinia triticina 1-1 BBBD Race 1]|uniref:Uncharacterized protein n=1 Tax=Puccinia triticina (isolate 1-1 / race 1 (BBBD)) TaxID=630390 RepID=A0A180GGM6_PUCT1|nr:hypothetical protein PTTG_12283 [Puccinia triticina 1-1 BBBD Race 1]